MLMLILFFQNLHHLPHACLQSIRQIIRSSKAKLPVSLNNRSISSQLISSFLDHKVLKVGVLKSKNTATQESVLAFFARIMLSKNNFVSFHSVCRFFCSNTNCYPSPFSTNLGELVIANFHRSKFFQST